MSLLAPTLPASAPQGGPEAMAGRLLAKASDLLAQCRPAEALPLLERLQHLEQVPPQLHANHAGALLALGRYHEAEAAAGRGLAAAPASPPLLHLRSRARSALGAHVEALDDAAAAVMAEPASPMAKALLADTLLKVGKFDEAIYLNWQAVQAEPEGQQPRLRLAQAFMMAGRHSAATELLLDLEHQAPGLTVATALRAQNHLLAGEAAAAEQVIRTVLHRAGQDAALHSVLAHALVAQGRLAEAGPHFRTASRLAPGDAYLAHLASAATGAAPDRASDDYVATVFDGYAARFEAELLGMGYRVPGLIRLAVEPWLAAAGEEAGIPGPVLDLGCGTGLVGVALLGLTGRGLVGVDLSQNMLNQARAKGIYTELHQAEVSSFLAGCRQSYALVTAGDIFCYFGALDGLLAACRALLAPDGLLMFTVEVATGSPPWQLRDTARYQHAASYIAEALAAAGLSAMRMAPETLRLNGDAPVAGLFVVARRAAC